MSILKTLFFPGHCLNCDKEYADHPSKFCSPGCKEEFEKDMPFSLTCVSCDADEGDFEDKTEAEKGGWEEVTADPEGLFWNWIGTCPECAAKEKEE